MSTTDPKSQTKQPQPLLPGASKLDGQVEAQQKGEQQFKEPVYFGDPHPFTEKLLKTPASQRVAILNEESQKHPRAVSKPPSPYTSWGTGGDTWMGHEGVKDPLNDI